MWVLNFLPDIFFHVALIVSILGIVCSIFLRFIPALFQYKVIIQICSVCLLIISVWYEGGIAKDKEYQTKIEEYKQRVLVAEALSDAYNTQLQNTIKENKKKIADISYSNKKKLKELSKKLNAECKVDKPIIDLLNNAAKGVSK